MLPELHQAVNADNAFQSIISVYISEWLIACCEAIRCLAQYLCAHDDIRNITSASICLAANMIMSGQLLCLYDEVSIVTSSLVIIDDAADHWLWSCAG